MKGRSSHLWVRLSENDLVIDFVYEDDEDFDDFDDLDDFDEDDFDDDTDDGEDPL